MRRRAAVPQRPTGTVLIVCGPGRNASFVDAAGNIEREEKQMDDRGMNPTPIRLLPLWRCMGCGELFEEDDLQQVQPDGHYACPMHDDTDPELVEVKCVTILWDQWRALLLAAGSDT